MSALGIFPRYHAVAVDWMRVGADCEQPWQLDPTCMETAAVLP